VRWNSSFAIWRELRQVVASCRKGREGDSNCERTPNPPLQHFREKLLRFSLWWAKAMGRRPTPALSDDGREPNRIPEEFHGSFPRKIPCGRREPGISLPSERKLRLPVTTLVTT
jgi:hypothetical protein